MNKLIGAAICAALYFAAPSGAHALELDCTQTSAVTSHCETPLPPYPPSPWEICSTYLWGQGGTPAWNDCMARPHKYDGSE